MTVVGIDHLQLAMPAGREAKKAHPGVVVSDLNALVKTLKDAGRVVSDGDVREAYEHAYVEDPFGNRLELIRRV